MAGEEKKREILGGAAEDRSSRPETVRGDPSRGRSWDVVLPCGVVVVEGVHSWCWCGVLLVGGGEWWWWSGGGVWWCCLWCFAGVVLFLCLVLQNERVYDVYIRKNLYVNGVWHEHVPGGDEGTGGVNSICSEDQGGRFHQTTLPSRFRCAEVLFKPKDV